MKATLFFETRPTDEANGWYHNVAEYLRDKAKKSAASDMENYLELRLSILSNSSSNDTAMTNASNRQSSLQDSTSNPDHALILGQKKFKLSPTTAAIALVSAGAAAATAEAHFINPHGAPSGFVHPWSLAARQQKAAYEKAYRKPKSPPSMPRVTHPSVSSLAVGWPPIRRFRKNLFFRSRMSHENGANPIVQANQGANVPAPGNPMFVKINMEGLTVGRKINISLYHGYDSFFLTMQKLFRNFLTAYIEEIDEEDDVIDDISDDFFVLYEDHEGDRILVGDVPWNVFVASVKRIIIMQNPKEGTDESLGGAQGVNA